MAEYIERPEYEEYKEKVDQRIKRGEARIEEAENNIKSLTELTSAVKELAINMKGVERELTKQGERLEKIEQEPADTWKTVKRTIITVIITALATAAVAALINIL